MFDSWIGLVCAARLKACDGPNVFVPYRPEQSSLYIAFGKAFYVSLLTSILGQSLMQLSILARLLRRLGSSEYHCHSITDHAHHSCTAEAHANLRRSRLQYLKIQSNRGPSLGLITVGPIRCRSVEGESDNGYLDGMSLVLECSSILSS